MFVELVTTGSELLLGEITNYNSAYLSRKLNEIGYSVIYHTTVGDNPQRMEEALKTALSRVDMVITRRPRADPGRYDQDHRRPPHGNASRL